jgi:hypothetical protein
MMGLVRAAPAVAAVAAVSLLAAPLVHRVVPTGGWADLTAAGACVRAVCPRRHLSSHVDATTAHSQGSSNDHIVFASQLCWPLAMNEHSLFVCIVLYAYACKQLPTVFPQRPQSHTCMSSGALDTFHETQGWGGTDAETAWLSDTLRGTGAVLFNPGAWHGPDTWTTSGSQSAGYFEVRVCLRFFLASFF